jgi:hypothetical protein
MVPLKLDGNGNLLGCTHSYLPHGSKQRGALNFAANLRRRISAERCD